MATKKKMLQAAAGNAGAGGAGLDITDVFSTYLYTGTSATQTITNGIDLDGEGGLVWIKGRSAAYSHYLFDTERGFTAGDDGNFISTNNTNAESYTGNFGVSAFNSTGFSLHDSWNGANNSPETFASWTFRKAPKFFDVIRWDGDGTNAREIPHNLGSVPHVMITRPYNVTAGGWSTAHYDGTTWRSGELNTTGSMGSPSPYIWGDRTNFIEPTDSVITVTGPVEGLTDGMNKSGYSYITYLFAHNDGDGEFGPDGDQDIIKCGSYTGNGSTDGPEIDLGFEPQWVMIKAASVADGWIMFDSMRGFTVNKGGGLFATPNDKALNADSSSAELSYNFVGPTSTGFQIESQENNASGETYIYMAIRRGPLAPPESGTEVFGVVKSDGTSDPAFNAGFPVDAALLKATTASNGSMRSRLTGTGYLETNSTGAEGNSGLTEWDYQDSWFSSNLSSSYYSWMWKRAPGFFDVVAYTGDDVVPRSVPHNLGVAPEMMWVKSRSDATSWQVYHKDITASNRLFLDQTSALAFASVWNQTSPTDSVFYLGSSWNGVNASGSNYIAYLFATLAGVSKVGSYTGDGTSNRVIDCGFTSGARFVLIKRTDSAAGWYVYDTARGIVSGNDSLLMLNSTNAEYTGDDPIDPNGSGFAINQTGASEINLSGAEYIFYAIA